MHNPGRRRAWTSYGAHSSDKCFSQQRQMLVSSICTLPMYARQHTFVRYDMRHRLRMDFISTKAVLLWRVSRTQGPKYNGVAQASIAHMALPIHSIHLTFLTPQLTLPSIPPCHRWLRASFHKSTAYPIRVRNLDVRLSPSWLDLICNNVTTSGTHEKGPLFCAAR